MGDCPPRRRIEACSGARRLTSGWWGGGPRPPVRHNLNPAVIQVLQGHSRREHEVFQHFHSVYCFEAIFANVRAGWEKGSVENLVGYARRNYLVPLPEGKDLELLNADLRYSCLTDQQRFMAGRTDPIASRLEIERAYLGPLPL